jgi:hypothetical protein
MISSIRELNQAALIEEGNKKKQKRLDDERLDLTRRVFQNSPMYFYIVNIYDKPVSLQEFKSFNPDIKATRGMYTIQYIPLCDKVRNPKFPYLIGQDLVRLRVTVSGPKHWDMICTRVPELGWVKRNSTLTGEMFRIAKMHPGLVLRFGIDFPKYCKKIEKAAEELGIDIDHKPLVCYQWSKKTGEKYKDIELAPVKTKADYLSALLETEQSKTVQSEIKEVKNK